MYNDANNNQNPLMKCCRIVSKRSICGSTFLKNVNKLQIKYNMIHFLYWFTTCSINGFTAIFLRTKGLSNTDIGLAVGIGAVFSILFSPFLSAIIVNTKWMTIRKMIVVIYTTSFLVYILMSYSGIPILSYNFV